MDTDMEDTGTPVAPNRHMPDESLRLSYRDMYRLLAAGDHLREGYGPDLDTPGARDIGPGLI